MTNIPNAPTQRRRSWALRGKQLVAFAVAIACALTMATTLLYIALAENPALVLISAFLGVVAHLCAYWLTRAYLENGARENILQGQQDETATPSALPATTVAGDVGVLLDQRHFVHYLCTTLLILFVALTLTLILSKLTYLDEFLIAGPMLLVYPLSYFAYSSFQRKVRITRLRLEFEMLGAYWSDDLAKEAVAFSNNALHIVLAILATVLGIVILLSPQLVIKDDFLDLASIHIPMSDITLSAVRCAFLGAYLISVQNIYRRFVTFDLQPTTYFIASVNIFLGIGVAYVAFQSGVIQSLLSISMLTSWQLVVAFFIGYAPPSFIRYFDGRIKRALKMRRSRAEEMPLSYLDGVSPLHEIRLNDNGIDNIQNLATADIPLLLINTSFSVQQVIDWVDQALLYLYFRELDREIPPFAEARVRTVTDFRDIWEEAYLKPDPCNDTPCSETKAALRVVRSKLFVRKPSKTSTLPSGEPTPSVAYDATELDALYEATNTGPNVVFLEKYWRAQKGGKWFERGRQADILRAKVSSVPE